MEHKLMDALPVVETIRAAARRLAVSQATIRRLLARGALGRVAVGRSVRVLSRSVDDLAERGGNVTEAPNGLGAK